MPYLRDLVVVAAAIAATQAGVAAGNPATADDADALAALVATRVANEGRVGRMHFLLENDGGSVRNREALMVHSERNGVERIAIFFTAPAMIEETAFLSFSRDDADDENWLFLPATDRVRRLPSSDRGDYFMGTDLTYGDIQDNFKFDVDDWEFGLAGIEVDGDTRFPVLTGRARTPEIAREMGYGAFRARIDTHTAFPVRIEYSDRDGEPLKQVDVVDIRRVGTAQTAMRFVVRNLQTGHTTRIHFTDMRFVPDLDDAVFEPETLSYGIPDIDN